MQYQKITSEGTTIEFHNNWMGEETVIVKGQVVSKKSSILGTDHPFTVLEKGKKVKFVLTTKLNANGEVLLDLRRNDKLVINDMRIPYGFMPKNTNKAKQEGIQKLKAYQLNEALEDLKKALKENDEDPEIYFHMACAYSVLEKPLEGFESLKKAVANNLQNTEMILNHDMLAFLRLHDAFDAFFESGFKKFDKGLLKG
jgi:tetratricopeptide (TPR) repeat protein